MDVELVREIRDSVAIVAQRFMVIEAPEDFASSPEGVEKLDAICMRLIAIGEIVKKLDRLTEGRLLSRHPDVQWKNVMGMRDVLIHHYFDVDVETIFKVCDERLDGLNNAVQRMLDETSPTEES